MEKKEFIQLRGFLVDMRYAENDDAERAAFDNLLAWLETAGGDGRGG